MAEEKGRREGERERETKDFEAKAKGFCCLGWLDMGEMGDEIEMEMEMEMAMKWKLK